MAIATRLLELADCRQVKIFAWLAHRHLFKEGEELLARDLAIFVGVHIFEEDVPVADTHLGVAETTFPLFFGDQPIAVLGKTDPTKSNNSKALFSLSFVSNFSLLMADTKYSV